MVVLALTAQVSPADGDDLGVKAAYAKTEHRIPMRDGVELFTVVYTPKDRSRTYPILLERTPYWAGPYGPGSYRSPLGLAPSEAFVESGYVFVIQELRGTYRSDGEWVDFRPPRSQVEANPPTDESTDAYDTIEWLLDNIEGHSGRVGQWGISYSGWTTVHGMRDAHPALKAASPQGTSGDVFKGDDYHRNGAFAPLNVVFLDFMSGVTGPGRRELVAPAGTMFDWESVWPYDFLLHAGPIDGYDRRLFGGRLLPAWQALIDHPNYDEYWQSRDFLAPLEGIRLPVLNVAAWFDQPDPFGTIATYRAIEEKNPDNRSTLVVGPWWHGGWHADAGKTFGDIDFGSSTAAYYRRHIVFPFFEHHLKGKESWSSPEAVVFETGSNRWHEFGQWPPPGVRYRNLYLREEGRLSFEKPEARGVDQHDRYLSDPNRPVPAASPGKRSSYTIEDQRYAYTRPDVLAYRSNVLEEDLTIAGPVPVKLFAATSGTDSDWIVKLIDVFPDDAPDRPEGVDMTGYQMLVDYWLVRGRFRNSLSRPEAMRTGEVTPIEFRMPDRFHTFRKGHRIMVQVKSTWFPVIDRNPQTFVENIYRATPGDFQPAWQRIHRSVESASHIALPIVDITDVTARNSE